MSEQLDTQLPQIPDQQAQSGSILPASHTTEKAVARNGTEAGTVRHPRPVFPRSRKGKLAKCGKRIYTPIGDVFIDAETPMWQTYRCRLRVCPRCETKRMRDFIEHVQPLVNRAMKEGADCHWVTLTIPKGEMKPGEALKALNEALRQVNKRDRFAGLGEDLVGWVRVGEMGKGLSPHVHMLVFVRPDTRGVKLRIKKAWESALAAVLDWKVRPERLFNSVKRLPDLDSVNFKLQYMSKGDPYRSYTDKQKQAWQIATKGWQNLRTSQNWSRRKARTLSAAAGTGNENVAEAAGQECWQFPAPVSMLDFLVSSPTVEALSNESPVRRETP